MFGRILEHKITLTIGAIACVAVLVIGGYYVITPPAHRLDTVPAQVKDISETITGSGMVDSDNHVSLSFKKAGTVAAVNVKVGDAVRTGQVLAALDSGDLQASLQGAEADVLTAEANLASLEKGATPQTRAVYDQAVSTALLNLATANQGAYLSVRDAILNKSDTLFQNGVSPNPTLQIPTDSYTTSLSLNQSRVDETTRMTRWNTLLGQNPTGADALKEASSDLLAAKSFIDSLSQEANRLSSGNSGLSVAQIATYISAVSAAATEINTATANFNSASQAYNSAVDQANVITASSTVEAITAAQAQVAKAEANVASVRSQIADMTLIAPFDGIVGSVNPKAGESFDASVPAIDVLSQGNYKIDIMVPENEVGVLTPGAQALVTFDAYGSNLEATATISSIDISPTVTNGISAYKTTLYLNSTDSRVRTGMTGNVTIQGPSAQGVLAIPASAVITENGSSFALVKTAQGSFVKQEIQTGITGDGWTEVRSGLSQGDLVAAFGDSVQ